MLEIFNIGELGDCEIEKFRQELLKIMKKGFEGPNEFLEYKVKEMTAKPCEVENLLQQRHYITRDTSNEIIAVANYQIKVLKLPSGKEVLTWTPVHVTDPKFQEQRSASSTNHRMCLDAIKFKSENGYFAPMYAVGFLYTPISYHLAFKIYKTLYPSPKFPGLDYMPEEIRNIFFAVKRPKCQKGDADVSPFVFKAPYKTKVIFYRNKYHGEDTEFFLKINPECKKGYVLVAVSELSNDNLRVPGLLLKL